MGRFSEMTVQLRALLAGRSRGQLAALAGIAATAVVLVVLLMRIGGSRSYVVAFTNLDGKDANDAVTELKAQNISYQLSQDGGTIKVPPDQIAAAKLKLAAKGLPQGGAVGFELFDKTSFGVTDFVQNVNFQRALEGELTRTIEQLDAVQSARVHIVVPKDALFVSQQQPATASVLLQLRPGRTLDSSALRGIAHLVSKSVQGLDEKNIALVDSSGRTLFDGSAVDGALGDSSSQQQLTNEIERDMETRLQSLLDKVVGPSRSAVRVKADIDFSQGQTVTESFSPGGPNNQGVTRSSSTVQETYNGAGQQGGQIPGASANLPGALAAATPGANSQYQRTETTNNYEVSKSTVTQTQVPGKVKRLSISVLLDGSIAPQDAAGLKDAIATSVGFDQSRGDQITVTTAAFSDKGTTTPTVIHKPGLLDSVSQYSKFALPLLAALVVVFAIWRMTRSAAPGRPSVAVVSATPALPPPGGIAAAYAGIAGGAQGQQAVAGAAGQGLPAPATLEIVDPHEEMRRRVATLADDDPEALAGLVRGWLQETRGAAASFGNQTA